jgi:diguanylate cyclase
MNFAFLPDISALAILVIILALMRRQHPHEQADMLLLGLFFTLVEAVAHPFYSQTGLPIRTLHVIVLNCYLLAGIIFLWASGPLGAFRWNRLRYLSLNALPLLAMNTTYGLHIYTQKAFLPWIALGLVTSMATALYMRRSWRLAALQVSGWLAVGYLVHIGNYRDAVYWSLSCIYALTAINFAKRLPTNSTGKLAILTGFIIWSLCFFVHPFIVAHRAYADIAAHIWNMQKSLISIGMILLMLEEQVANNRWLALHDSLTGLRNRRWFEDQLTEELERHRRANGSSNPSAAHLAVFLLDLNGFKQINDSFGHHAGDEVLCEVARRLRDDVEGCDALARLGGDEFTMIVCNVADPDATEQLAYTIQATVERPLLVDGRTLTVTACLGVAFYPEDGQDASRLLRVADQRMYAFKQRTALPPSLNELSPSTSL